MRKWRTYEEFKLEIKSLELELLKQTVLSGPGWPVRLKRISDELRGVNLEYWKRKSNTLILPSLKETNVY